MASLPQMSATLGLCISSNKIIKTHAQPCIAQFHNKKSTTQFSNLVAKNQIILFPFALGGHNKRPIIELWKQCQNEKWKARIGEDREFVPTRSLIETTVKEFYEAFNAKKIENLEQLLSDDCVYQDLLFYHPFKGQQDVINFLQNVMEVMGPNIKIAVKDVKVEDVREDNLMAIVLWQLKCRREFVRCRKKMDSNFKLSWIQSRPITTEWENKKIPYTHGCRFFRFKKEEERLIICEINGMEELPLKPGELILNVFKAMRTFLDSYPPMARALLDSPAFQEDSTHGGSP